MNKVIRRFAGLVTTVVVMGFVTASAWGIQYREIEPVQYSFSVDPTGNYYPDSGGELTDGVYETAPWWLDRSSYVGWRDTKGADITFDFLSSQEISKITIGTLYAPRMFGSINWPIVNIAAGDDLSQLTSVVLPTATSTGNILDYEGLNIDARYVRLSLPYNEGWTFISEVDFLQLASDTSGTHYRNENDSPQVPDGGGTIALLGLALMGISAMGQKMKR